MDKKISELTAKEVFSKEIIEEIYSVADEVERSRLIGLLTVRAKELKVEKELRAVIKAYSKIESEMNDNKRRQAFDNEYCVEISRDKYYNPLKTIENFLTIIENDIYFASLRFNKLTYSPEHTVEGKNERWIDSDDAKARNYIEQKYNLHHAQKFEDALRINFSNKEYHPIIEMIEKLPEWDYECRVDHFLTDCLKCEDTPYVREVSRLIFAGGINRAYNNGCKFDCVPVLIGTKQGEGKSTIVEWLAMNEEYYTEVSDIEGQKGMEAIEGAWICELGELLALTKAKEVEAIKAYISRKNDRYRMPFDKRVTDHKRQCIFIGTTNKEQFLTDITGNRRFFPVKVNQNGYELYENKEFIQDYIKKCWAEARERFKSGVLPPYPKKELLETIREAQSTATEEDYRIGLITEYLKDKYTTCVLDIWQNCFNEYYSKPSKKDSAELGQILDRIPRWERNKIPQRFGQYGHQRVWNRRKLEPIDENELPF